jgi:putative FmdB family regulatory protein
MPIYEYRCEDCGRVSSFLVKSFRDPEAPRCKRCQSGKMTRLLSRVVRVRSEESRLESLADPAKLSGLDENDPAGMARWMKRMGKELGEDMGEDIDAMVDEAMEEEGKTPQGKAADAAPEDDL